MLKLLQKEFILEPSRIQSERMGTVNHMKDLYDAARHLVWLTQFGLSVVLPPVLFLLGAVWLRKQFGLGGWVILVGFALGMVAAIIPALAILPAWLSYGPESGILTLALAIIMFSRHYHGLLRIRQGTEPRFFQRRNPK